MTLVFIVLALAGLALAWHCVPILLARYDGEAMRVEPPQGRWPPALAIGDAQRSGTWQSLERWCFEGAGDGRAPWYWPQAMPRVALRFTVAVLTGADRAGKSRLAEAFSRQLDGSVLLEALPGAGARRRLRLWVKACDCMWWRARRPGDPWDCGYLVDDAANGSAALDRLRHFLPRRATLLLADALPTAALLERIAVLRARQAEFRHPVRLLILAARVPAELDAAEFARLDF